MNTKRFFITSAGLLVASLLGIWLVAAAQSGPGDAFPMYSPIEPVGDPDIRLVKTIDNSDPMPGDQVEYTLTYWNAEPGSIAYNVRLFEFLPAGVQYVSASPEPDLRQNRMLRFDWDSIGPGTTPREVRVVVEVKSGVDQLYNHALVGADGVVPVHAALRTLVTQPAASLRLLKSGYEYTLINGPIVYNLMCQNTSESASASNVKVVDVLPGGVSLVGASPPPDVVNLPLLTWSAGSLAPGERFDVVITATAPSMAGVITNTALADAQERVVTETLFATQVVSEGAILVVDKTSNPYAVRPGQQLRYRLRYANIGNQTATGVTMTDTLPAGIEVVGYSPSGSATMIGDQIVWDIGTLPGDVVANTYITLTALNPGDRTLINIVDIVGGPGSFPGHDVLETDVLPHRLYLPIVIKVDQVP